MADDMRFVLLSLLLSGSASCSGSDLDIQCLKTVRESVIDPNGILKSSWIFENNSFGFICRFTGVECWHPDENRVLSLRLSNLGLQGQFPQGLENCTSMTGLDLSSNNFSGPIPSNIAWQLSSLTFLDLSYNKFSGELPIGISNITYLNTLNLQHNQLRGQIPDRYEFSSNNFSGPISSDIARQLPYLSSLDLSYNNFLGEIPLSISNMVYLNGLNLQHNQLSGQIPEQFSGLARLTSFNVADNLLSGTIPSTLQKFPASTFASNRGLCDAPLDECPSRKTKRRLMIHDESVIGAAVGFA
ncbi:hypothetical protein SETIT_5G410300v2, partial [Setaria italica]